MTLGVTAETVDGMTLEKIRLIIYFSGCGGVAVEGDAPVITP
jgi:hypothetical protein